jgi:hypothetical protein
VIDRLLSSLLLTTTALTVSRRQLLYCTLCLAKKKQQPDIPFDRTSTDGGPQILDIDGDVRRKHSCWNAEGVEVVPLSMCSTDRKAAYLPPECADECESFFRTAHRPASGRVTFAAYREYLTSRVKPRWPKIATHVWNLLGACPTEACVERGFSFLRFLATDWRSRLEEERVEALLQIPSCFFFFFFFFFT